MKVLLALLLALPLAAQTITHEELVRRTQALLDAVAVGDRAPWNEYYADDAVYFDEKGRRMDKATLVADIAPLPAGYVGAILIENAKSRFYGDTAIVDYDLDESLTIHGQRLDNARFHGTDTWLRRDGKWQIVATQMLRYYEDPAPVAVDAKKLDAYTATYELAPGVQLKVWREGDALWAQRTGRAKAQLFAETEGLFYRKGVEGRYLFAGDRLIDRRNNQDIVWKRVPVFTLTSPAFKEGETMPESTVLNGLACKGPNRSPELVWSNAPEGTKSFALICDDYEARDGDGFIHWVAFNIPASVTRLPENAGASNQNLVHAYSDFLQRKYDGPCPPEGPAHKYRFTLYALDLPSIEDAGTPMTWRKLRVIIKGHVLGEASLTGLYGR
ncbi:MAG: YbhB/YbcL family Raf kinase inhibitor-like protein [Thermoanaerobaculia bacterium]